MIESRHGYDVVASVAEKRHVLIICCHVPRRGMGVNTYIPDFRVMQLIGPL